MHGVGSSQADPPSRSTAFLNTFRFEFKVFASLHIFTQFSLLIVFYRICLNILLTSFAILVLLHIISMCV